MKEYYGSKNVEIFWTVDELLKLLKKESAVDKQL